MGRLGADPTELRELARLFETEANRLGTSLRRVGAGVRSSSWAGPDARRFAERWQGDEQRARTALDALGGAAEDLRRNATEQETASEGTGSTSGAGPSASGTAAKGTAAQGTPAASAATAPGAQAAMTSTAPDPGPPPLGEALPIRTETWVIGGGISSGIGVSGTARLGVDDMPGGRSMVWVEDRDQTGASGGLSAGVELGRSGASAGADGSLAASMTTRRSWIVDADDTGELLARLGLQELIGAGIVSPGLPGRVGALGVPLFGPVVDRLGLGAPAPSMSDHLVSLHSTFGVGATAAVPLLGSGVAGLAGLGIRERPSGTSLLVEMSASHSNTGPAGRSIGGGTGAGSVTVEVPLGDSGSQRAIVTRTHSVDGGEVVTRSVHELDRDVAVSTAARALHETVAGNVDGGGDAVMAIVGSIRVEPLWTDSMGGTVDDDVHTVDVGAALGADLGGSVTGGRRVVNYQR